MKLSNAKGMVLPALGVGAGMVASPKVAGIHPFLTEHPYLPPIILVLLALALLRYEKARPFALGLGAVALVFLVMAIWGKISGGAVAGATEGTTELDKWLGEYKSAISGQVVAGQVQY